MSIEAIRFLMHRAKEGEDPSRVDMSISTVPDPDLKALLSLAEKDVFPQYRPPFIISEQIEILGQLGWNVDEHNMRSLIYPRNNFPAGIIKHGFTEVLGKTRPVFNHGQMLAAVAFLSTWDIVQISWYERNIPYTLVLNEAVKRLGGPNHPISDCFNPPLEKRVLDKEAVLKDIAAVQDPDLKKDLNQKAVELLAILEDSGIWMMSRPKVTEFLVRVFKQGEFAKRSKNFESYITNLFTYQSMPKGVPSPEGKQGVWYPPEHILALCAFLYECEQICIQGIGGSNSVKRAFDLAIGDLGQNHKYSLLLKGELFTDQPDEDELGDQSIIYDTDEGREILEGVGIEELSRLAETIQPHGRVNEQNFTDVETVIYQAILEIRRTYFKTEKGIKTPYLQNREYLGWVNSCIRLIRNPNVNGCNNLLQALEYMKAQEQKTLQQA